MKLYLFIISCMICSLLSAQEPAIKQDLEVGLVLSGGGARGLAYIGVLRVLEEIGICIDYIGGTSMGAMVGTIYVASYSANELDSVFRSLNSDKLLQDKISHRSKSLHERYFYNRYAVTLPFSSFKIGLPRVVSKGQSIYNEFIKLLYPVDKIYDFSQLPTPFLCVVTDMEIGKGVVLENGFSPQAIKASGSFLSLSDLVEIDGRLLTDGGIMDNYPVDEIKKKGVNVVIGVDMQSPLVKREEINSVLGILS